MAVGDNMHRQLIAIPKDKLGKIVAAAKVDNRSISNYFVTLAINDVEEKESKGIVLEVGEG